jgi:hypothetical protein
VASKGWLGCENFNFYHATLQYNPEDTAMGRIFVCPEDGGTSETLVSGYQTT